MHEQKRMSPLTAFFLGVFGLAGTAVVSATVLAGYGLSIADHNVETLMGFVDQTLASLPEIIDALPEATKKLLSDRRDPSYASKLDVEVKLVRTGKGRVQPSLTIINNGDEVVSLLAVRVVLLNEDAAAVREWTEIVATPIAIGDWRGPIMPHMPRHVVLDSYRGFVPEDGGKLRAVFEISDVRVWEPKASVTVAGTSS